MWLRFERGNDPVRNSGFDCFVQNVCTDEGQNAFEMFDVHVGLTPYSFAKHCFTGGKCLMGVWQVVPNVHMFYKFVLQLECTSVTEFWAVCRVMPFLLGGG